MNAAQRCRCDEWAQHTLNIVENIHISIMTIRMLVICLQNHWYTNGWMEWLTCRSNVLSPQSVINRHLLFFVGWIIFIVCAHFHATYNQNQIENLLFQPKNTLLKILDTPCTGINGRIHLSSLRYSASIWIVSVDQTTHTFCRFHTHFYQVIGHLHD